jgi:hypothetical protein
VLCNQRKAAAQAHTLSNAITLNEREEIVGLCNLPEYSGLAPTQVVPRLADASRYLASESSFYRVLRDVGQVNGRNAAEQPRQIAKLRGFCATAPNQIWSWDITFLAISSIGCI